MKSILFIFSTTIVSFVTSIPSEIKELRQKLDEAFDKDDMVHNKLHEIEVKLIILTVDLNRYKRSASGNYSTAIVSTGTSVVSVGDKALVATTADSTAVVSTVNSIVRAEDRTTYSNSNSSNSNTNSSGNSSTNNTNSSNSSSNSSSINSNDNNSSGSTNRVTYIISDSSDDYASLVDVEDAVETKMLEAIKMLESEKARLKAKLCKLEKKKNRLKRTLRAKSLSVFKTSIALGAIIWSTGYLGVIILFMISPDGHDGRDLRLHNVYKSILGFTAGMFIQIFKSYYELDAE
nr:hypothetical protein MACL_00000486 [Theileria orientalis]